MPVPSLRTTSTAAAAIEASAVRDWPAPYARAVLAPQRQRVVRGHRLRVEAGVACGRVPRPAGGAAISLPTPVAEGPMGIPEADELAAQALSALSSSP